MHVIKPDEDTTGLEPSEAAMQVMDLDCQLTLPVLHGYWREYVRLFREHMRRRPMNGRKAAHRLAMRKLESLLKVFHEPEEQAKAIQALQLIANVHEESPRTDVNSRCK